MSKNSLDKSSTLSASSGSSARENFTSWLDLVSEGVFAFSASGYRPEGQFSATAAFRSLGAFDIFSERHTQDFRYRLCHYLPEVKKDTKDSLHVMYLHTGNIPQVRCHGREQEMLPGNWMLLRSGDEVDCIIPPGRSGFASIRLPTTSANLNQDAIDAILGRRMVGHTLPNQLVSGYIQAFAASFTGSGDLHASDIATNLLDLISIAARPNHDTIKEHSEALSSGLLLAVTQHLDRHFTDPELSPTAVAAHFTISTRYLHYLFSRQGHTFNEYLYDKRLRHAHAMLANPLFRDRSILFIAVESGFGNLTHFGRRFRQMYGLSPRNFRNQAGTTSPDR